MKKYLIIAAVFLSLLSVILMLNNNNNKMKHEMLLLTLEKESIEFDAKRLRSKLSVVEALDNEFEEKLRDAKFEIDRLRADVRDGTKRVYVNAVCPASVHTPAETPGVVDVGAVELAGDAREDYLRLRVEMEEDRVKILGLQAYISDVCLVEDGR